MKHLSQQMLQMELRRPHLRRMRARVTEMLRRPGISPEEATTLRARLEVSGSPKHYGSESISAAAIDPGPMPSPPVELKPDLTFSLLANLPHARLYSYATQQGLDVRPNYTKAQIATTVWAHFQGEKS